MLPSALCIITFSSLTFQSDWWEQVPFPNSAGGPGSVLIFGVTLPLASGGLLTHLCSPAVCPTLHPSGGPSVDLPCSPSARSSLIRCLGLPALSCTSSIQGVWALPDSPSLCSQTGNPEGSPRGNPQDCLFLLYLSTCPSLPDVQCLENCDCIWFIWFLSCFRWEGAAFRNDTQAVSIPYTCVCISVCINFLLFISGKLTIESKSFSVGATKIGQKFT